MGMLEFMAGRIHVPETRDFLSSLRLLYPDLIWHEGKGLFSKRFAVVGSHGALQRVEEWIERKNRE